MLDWLLTYVLHSSVAGMACLGALVVLRRATPAVRVVALRATLLGPIVTATVATFVTGIWPGGPGLDGARTAPARSVIALARVSQVTEREPDRADSLAAAVSPGAAERGATIASEPAIGRGGASRAASRGLSILPWGFAAIGLLAVLRLGVRARSGSRRLAPRTELRDDASVLRATELLGAPVRLSECAGLATPLALGRSEVVVPTGSFDQVTDGERDALLAHEIAHLARRDTLWSGLARFAAAVTTAQPLQIALLRRLEDETELAADAWAVRRTRRPLELARCLERVGARLAPVGATGRSEPLGGVAMARRASTLVRRVEELCAADADAAGPRTGTASALCLGLVVLAACGAPAVRGDDGVEPEASNAAAALSGDEAFELFRGVMTENAQGFDLLRGADFAGQYIETERGRLDFSPHDWDNRSPELHFEADRTPSGDTRIRSFGQEFAGVEAVDVFLKRLYQERHDIRISIDPSRDVAMSTVKDLIDAAIYAGFSHIDISASRGYPEPEEILIEDHDETPMETAEIVSQDVVGPFVVTNYEGPDAEVGERRYTLRLLEHGGVDRLPTDGVVDSSWVTGPLHREMRRGPLGETGLTALQDRVVIEGRPETPFSFAQAWMGNFARPDLLAYKIELALVGEEPVSAFLPFDVGVVSEEIEEGAEVELQEGPQEGPIEVRVVHDDGRTVYEIGPRRVTSHERAAADALRLAAELKPSNLVVVYPSRKATFTDVVPLVRELRAGGVEVAFTGAVAGPNLDRSLRGEGR